MVILEDDTGMTQEELDDFHQFASQRINNGGAHLNLVDLYELWRLDNPTPAEEVAIYRALDESLEDMRAGRTEAVDEVMHEILAKHSLKW